ncbi:MAG: hypothetical protein KIS92_20880, partial [Planctomycetota bacterium]|nr:hypothetical protein [Planctomycetota bacterium]
MAKSRSVALLAALVLGVAVAWVALRAVTHSPERLAETLSKDSDPERRRAAAEALAGANDAVS